MGGENPRICGWGRGREEGGGDEINANGEAERAMGKRSHRFSRGQSKGVVATFTPPRALFTPPRLATSKRNFSLLTKMNSPIVHNHDLGVMQLPFKKLCNATAPSLHRTKSYSGTTEFVGLFHLHVSCFIFVLKYVVKLYKQWNGKWM